MKVVFLICLALASPALTADHQLTEDIFDFVDLLPLDEIEEITLKYLQNIEFLTVLDYVLNGQEFKDILVSFETIPEYIEILSYLDESGVDVYGYLAILYDTIGLPPRPVPLDVTEKKNVGLTIFDIRVKLVVQKLLSMPKHELQNRGIVNDLREEIRVLFPHEQLRALHQEKLKTSQAFAFFVDRVVSAEMYILTHNLLNNDDFAKSINILNANGLDLEGSGMIYAELLGFGYHK